MDANFINELSTNREFLGKLLGELSPLLKQDSTLTSANVPSWFDLSPIVQYMFPFKEFIPLVSRIPREPGNGDLAHHWRRVTAINPSRMAMGVQEGQRAGRIGITTQAQSAVYKFLGLESSVTFQAWLASKNMMPDALGIDLQSTLRSAMIGEEMTVIHGNSALVYGPVGTIATSVAGTGSDFAGGQTIFLMCVPMNGLAWLYFIANGTIPGLINRTNPDGSIASYGGGTAVPSAEASAVPAAGNYILATIPPVTGAVAYAWFVSPVANLATGQETFRGISYTNSARINGYGLATGQPVVSLQSGTPAAYQDNSVNPLLFDGILTQIYGSVFGAAPGTQMATNTLAPNLTVQASGALTYQGATGNTGLTVQGSNISELDQMLAALYDQYKLSPDRILLSSSDLVAIGGQMFASNASGQFFQVFDAEGGGRIVAGRRITSYLNKVLNVELPIEVHPFLPPGTMLLWSDRVPYELSGVQYVTCIRTRMDYYQLRWPLRTTAWEFGVYMDEVMETTFCPSFAVLSNMNPSTGVPLV